jgi:hypothetical protein
VRPPYSYLRARYYDPQTAQFLTRDPLEAPTQQPYQYAHGDPLDETDPTGMGCGWTSPQDCVKDAGSAVAGGVSSAAGAVASGVTTAASDIGSGAASGAEWTWNHKEQVGLIVGGTVLVVGGTVLTFGVADALAASIAAAEAEGALGGLEAVDIAIHAPFVLAPGITLVGAGAGAGAGGAAAGYGIYSLVNGHQRACP